MDVYDLRREIVARIIKNRYNGNQADFCGMTGLSPSYVTRMLKAQTEKAHKKIGEEMARRLEAVEDLHLEPNELLDPKEALLQRPGRRPKDPPADFSDRHEVDDSDWTKLQAVKTMMPERQLAELVQMYLRSREDVESEIQRRLEAAGGKPK